jgi:hypothetical protein
MRLPIILACLALVSCGLAPAGDQAEKAKEAADNTELRDAIHTPLDKAKTANDPNVQADKDREQAIKDAGG